MKINLRRNQIFALIIAFMFIFYGIANAIFKFNVDKKIIDEVSFILLIVAGGLIFSGRKKKEDNNNQDVAKENEDKKEN